VNCKNISLFLVCTLLAACGVNKASKNLSVSDREGSPSTNVAPQPRVTIFPPFRDAIWSAAFTPDQKYVLVYDNSHRVELREVSTGNEIFNIQYQKWVGSVEISPDGKYGAVAALPEGFVHIFEIPSGREVQALPVPSAIAQFTNDSKKIFVHSNKGIGLFDIATGKNQFEIEGYRFPNEFEVSPDGKLLYASDGINGSSLYNVETAAKLRSFNTAAMGAVIYATIAPNSKFMATVPDGAGKKAFLIDLTSGKEIAIDHGVVRPAALPPRFSPDSQEVAFVYEDSILLKDTSTGTVTLLEKPVQGRILALAYSPNGKYLAIGSYSGDFGSYIGGLTVIDRATKNVVFTANQKGMTVTLKFSNDGSKLFMGSEKGQAQIISF
jgi:WD40 repeat protein